MVRLALLRYPDLAISAVPLGGFHRGPKIGRNTPCPCGSGKKFKRCCGVLASPAPPLPLEQLPQEIKQKLEEIKALQLQRERQQGLGRPIVSEEFKGYRIVAVGNRLFWSKKWRTFHDFLFQYIKDALGTEWGNLELAKPIEQRHPILQWYHKLCEIQAATIKEQGKVHSSPITGAVARSDQHCSRGIS